MVEWLGCDQCKKWHIVPSSYSKGEVHLKHSNVLRRRGCHQHSVPVVGLMTWRSRVSWNNWDHILIYQIRAFHLDQA